jgi:hypothetical protein
MDVTVEFSQLTLACDGFTRDTAKKMIRRSPFLPAFVVFPEALGKESLAKISRACLKM